MLNATKFLAFIRQEPKLLLRRSLIPCYCQKLRLQSVVSEGRRLCEVGCWWSSEQSREKSLREHLGRDFTCHNLIQKHVTNLHQTSHSPDYEPALNKNLRHYPTQCAIKIYTEVGPHTYNMLLTFYSSSSFHLLTYLWGIQDLCGEWRRWWWKKRRKEWNH